MILESLRKEVKKLNLSVNDFSSICKISRQTASRIYSGHDISLTTDVVDRICQHLNITVTISSDNEDQNNDFYVGKVNRNFQKTVSKTTVTKGLKKMPEYEVVCTICGYRYFRPVNILSRCKCEECNNITRNKP